MSAEAAAELLDSLQLEKIEDDIFRGPDQPIGSQRVYGGLVAAQALAAACHTVASAKTPHSLHAYFLLAGDPSAPIVYSIERLRDGKRFATRSCRAIQHGKVIFQAMISFHVTEEGFSHAEPMPEVPPPEILPNPHEFAKTYGGLISEELRNRFLRDQPFEIRRQPPEHMLYRKAGEPRQFLWFKLLASLPEGFAQHHAVLAYISDFGLLDTAMIVHGRTIFDQEVRAASLDHALWFHRPFRVDQWLLYVQDSPNSYGARGMSRGQIFTQDGHLIASVAQEGLIRPLG